MAGLFMWNSGNLLALNVGLSYGVGPAILEAVARPIPVLGLVLVAPLTVAVHTVVTALFCSPVVAVPWAIGNVLGHLRLDAVRENPAEAEHFPDLMMGFTKDSPEYPREALREGVEGQVLLEVVADAEGDAVDVRVLKSENALLTEAAVEVARRPSPDGDPSLFHWKPGRNTMLVDFQLDEPRRLTADSPVPAVGYLTSAPLGLLILQHEFADYPDEAKNTHVQGKVEVRIDAECERGRSQGSGPSWQRALARCGSESRTALAVFTPRLRPQPGNRDLRFSNHRLIDRSESHGPRPTIQMRPARRRRNRSPRDAPRAGRLLQGAGGGERSGRAPPFSVPRILACFFSTSRCPSRTGSTSCVKSRARRTHRRQ